VSVPPRLRAPRQDRAVVAHPPLAEAGTLLAENRRRLAGMALDLLGRPLADLRRRAREAAVGAAQAYLDRAGEPVPPADPSSLLVSGHQPELFHPGVWVKNFALNGLARRHGATPLNLVVDSDTVKTTALRVPTRSVVESAWPRAKLMAFDRWSPEVPFEERAVRDEGFFAGFACRVTPLLRDWGYTPLLPAFWEEVVGQARRTPLLGERIVAARRAWERRWGCHNLEVPVSALCRTEPFAWFAAHLLADLPRFHTIYNATVRAYRQAHEIRSRNHPVPDLAAEEGWLEAPFWAWRAGTRQRGRLFARQAGSHMELRVGSDRVPVGNGHGLVEGWPELERQGWKVRSRALTTTLFARLFLADSFMHGLGGGLYDELTDAIARQFYGVELPGFLVLSATLLLPLPAYPVREDSVRHLAHELRDLHFNPERHLERDGEPVRTLVAEKEAWIARQPATSPERRERFHRLRELTEALRSHLGDRERQVAELLQRARRDLRANTVLRRRDYAFCLYPEADLRGFCAGFLGETEGCI
jgi:hypothetical protein